LSCNESTFSWLTTKRTLDRAGYETTEAENGEKVLANIVKQRPDLILMDIQLPIMDGYEPARQL
jgi:CheY-like chemotaxis protein